MSHDNKLFKMVIGSHYFKILKPTPRMLGVLYRFSTKYAVKGFVKGKGFTILKLFAIKTKDSTEFRFHIGQLEEFKRTLFADAITDDMYGIEYNDMFNPVKIKTELKPGWVLRDNQLECKEFSLKSIPRNEDNNSRLITLPTGSGKLVPLSTPIKIPGGWTTNGELKLGQDIITQDGSTCQVTGIFPQGVKNMMRISFADGRSTLCGMEHLWRVVMATKEKKNVVINTKEIIRLLKLTHYSNRLYVPLCLPEQNPDVELPMDPYFLGAMLGDGSFKSDGTINFTSYTKVVGNYMTNKVKKHLHKDCEMSHYSNNKCHGFRSKIRGKKNPLNKISKQLKLNGKIHYQKSVPEIYLHASLEQKLQLLRGLMDTDGTVDGGTPSYSTSSKQLAQDVQYLIRSIGGIAKITSRYPKYSHKGEKLTGRLAYRVWIRLPRNKDILTHPKKIRRLKEINQYSETLKLRIIKVEYESNEESQCISVSHPSKLYVVEDFIVTHNTVTALSVVAEIKQRTAICVLGGYMDKWGSDVQDCLTTKAKRIMMVRGSKQLKGVIDAGIDNSLDADFLIFSLTTLNNFYKKYEEHHNNFEETGYSCTPEDMCKTLGIGTIIIDETHQHLHAVYKLLSYSHIPKVIALSATLVSDDPIIQRMQHIMFPSEIRYDKVKMKKYIKLYPISYRFKDMKKSKIRVNEYGSTTYSHTAFEKSVIKHKETLDNYLKLIADLVRIGYDNGYMKDDKLIIFAATVDMCTVLTEYFKKLYPDRDVRRYVDKDPYKNIIEPDIRITTVQSGGTAVDIKDLRTAIMTNNLKSTVSNFQAFGRLRELKDRDVKFYYIYAEEIPKHVEFHQHRKRIFQDRSLHIKDLHCPLLV